MDRKEIYNWFKTVNWEKTSDTFSKYTNSKNSFSISDAKIEECSKELMQKFIKEQIKEC